MAWLLCILVELADSFDVHFRSIIIDPQMHLRMARTECNLSIVISYFWAGCRWTTGYIATKWNLELPSKTSYSNSNDHGRSEYEILWRNWLCRFRVPRKILRQIWLSVWSVIAADTSMKQPFRWKFRDRSLLSLRIPNKTKNERSFKNLNLFQGDVL
jgi:hypothetical protein